MKGETDHGRQLQSLLEQAGPAEEPWTEGSAPSWTAKPGPLASLAASTCHTCDNLHDM